MLTYACYWLIFSPQEMLLIGLFDLELFENPWSIQQESPRILLESFTNLLHLFTFDLNYDYLHCIYCRFNLPDMSMLASLR